MVSMTPIFHLLVVDDNPTNLELMARIVENHLPEVRCIKAVSAEEAFAILATERIDGAFVDVQMPKISGFEMCRRLKADPQTAHIPVVLLTAHIATPQGRAEGLDAGAQDFISQPVSNIEMLARIRVMLRLQGERAHLTRQNQKLHRQLENNVAALRWLTGLAEADRNANDETKLLENLASRLNGAQEPTLDQFANWLLPELPPGWQQALLQLALLKEIPLALAQRLTGFEDIEAILDYLWRHNYHVESFNGGYRFDEQLHGYLLAQARIQLSDEEQRSVHRLVADWYQEKQNFWMALHHLLLAQSYAELEFLLSQTGFLLPVTAPADALELLDLLPQELAAKQGWFSFFVGSLKLRFAPDEVDNWLELARVRFIATGDRRGELLTLVQQVVLHLMVDGRFSFGRKLLPRIIELLVLQQNDLDAVNLSKVYFALALGFGFIEGDINAGKSYARLCLQQGQQSRHLSLELEGRIVCAYMAMQKGSGLVALSEVENAWKLCGQGLNAPAHLSLLAADLLLHLGDLDGYREQRRQLTETFNRQSLQKGTFSTMLCLFDLELCLLEGDWDLAAEMLSIGSAEGVAAGNPHLQSWLLQYRALSQARSGQPELARQHLRKSLSLREQAGGGTYLLENLLVCAETSYELDDLDGAQSLLESALVLSRTTEEQRARPAIHAALARLFHARAETVKALDHLQEFLLLLSSRTQKCCFFLTPELLKILPLAVENGVLPEVACRLSTDFLHADIENNGLLVPHLQISLLGPFRLQVAKRPPIEASILGSLGRHLLGLLIFAPGQQLSVDSIYGQIWVDSSSERARQNFDSTLLRLRKAVDEACGEGAGRSYLALEKGVLFLRHARVDALRYKAHVEVGRTLQRRGDCWQAIHQLLAADRLWLGKLMEGFDLPGDFFDKQEIFDELRFEQIELLASLSEPHCSSIDLEALLLKGLQADPIRESLIKRLLELYTDRQDQVKRKKLLNQYRKSLQAEDFTLSEIDEIIRSLQDSTSKKRRL